MTIYLCSLNKNGQKGYRGKKTLSLQLVLRHGITHACNFFFLLCKNTCALKDSKIH